MLIMFVSDRVSLWAGTRPAPTNVYGIFGKIYNLSMPEEKVEDWQIRKNGLRLRGFDYSARRSNFVTIVTEHRQTFFND